MKIYFYTVMNYYNNHSKYKKGFTLVELIVSMALFIIVVFIVTSAFLTLANLNKKAHATRAAMDTLNIAVEFIARELRMASFYHCGISGGNINVPNSAVLLPKDCSSGGSDNIVYKDAAGNYGGFLQRFYSDEGVNIIHFRRPNYSCCSHLTNFDMNITNLSFYSFGTITGASTQPRLSIVIEGEIGTDSDKTKFNIYTSVTQRTPKN